MKKHILLKLSLLRSIQEFLPILILLPLLISLLISCNTTEPPSSQTLTLKLEDVSCTEAWIQFSSTNNQTPNNISLLVNGSVKKTFTLNTKDSLLYIDSLLPNQTYKILAAMQQSNNVSNELSVTTLDTTSSNFTWQTFTFGDAGAGSSTLYDVAIIDENNIWAVGEIYLLDSLRKPDPLPYNAVHWNGNQWELKRITINFRGSYITTSLEGIFAFSSSQIWLAGGLAIFGDGNKWTPYDVCQITGYDSLSFTKCWGSSYNNMYYSGRNGSLASYNNGQWSKIENGTTTNLNDIWGISDLSTGNSLILSTVSSRYQLGDYKLLSISGNTATEYFSWPYTRLYGVWFNSPRNIYVVGDGAYVHKNNSLKTINLTTNYFLTRVKGNALNDIYISTSGAEIIHYNGIGWREMSDGIYGKYEGLDVKGGTVVLVGYNIEGGIVGKAIITLGKHY